MYNGELSQKPTVLGKCQAFIKWMVTWDEIINVFGEDSKMKYVLMLPYICAFSLGIKNFSETSNYAIAVIVFILLLMVVRLQIITTYFLQKVLIGSSEKLGIHWFFISEGQFILIIFFVVFDQDKDVNSFFEVHGQALQALEIIFVFIILYFCVEQIGTIRTLIAEILREKLYIAKTEAVVVSMGLVVSHILFFMIVVYMVMLIDCASFTLDDVGVMKNGIAIFDGFIYVVSTYLRLGISKLQPSNWITVCLTGSIAITGIIMFSFLIAAIMSSVNNIKKDGKQTEYLLEIDHMIISIGDIITVLRKNPGNKVENVERKINNLKEFCEGSCLLLLENRLWEEDEEIITSNEEIGNRDKVREIAKDIQEEINNFADAVYDNNAIIEKAEFLKRMENSRGTLCSYRNELLEEYQLMRIEK